MNREQVLQWAREASFIPTVPSNPKNRTWIADDHEVEHFARLVRAAALEEAKEACLSWGEEHRIEAGEAVDEQCEYRIAAETLADAIEALKVKP